MPGIPIADARHFLCTPVRGAGQTVRRGREVAAKTSGGAPPRGPPPRAAAVACFFVLLPRAFRKPYAGSTSLMIDISRGARGWLSQVLQRM